MALPIIGADFLRHFGLLVNLGEMRLLACKGGWSQQLVAPSGSGMFSTIGVVADQPPQLRSMTKKKHVEADATARASASTSASNPTEEALSSPSLHTVEAHGSSPSLQHMLDEFPSVLNTSKVLPKPTHRAEHFLVTEGCPVTAKYRRLDNNRLEVARRSLLSWRSKGSSEDPAAIGLLLSTW